MRFFLPLNTFARRVDLKLLFNFINLSFIQLVNLLSPLIIYPLLIKSYGLNDFGYILFHQGIIAFLAIVINFGFYITGVKDVSQCEGKYSEVVSNILTIKLGLWLVCLMLVLLSFFINIKNVEPELLLLCYFSTFYELLFVQWFFQGVDNLKWISLINVAGKLLLMLLFFVFINSDSSVYVAPTIYAFVNLLTGIFSFLLMVKVYKIRYVKPSLYNLTRYLKDSSPIFISNITVSIKDRLSTILIGYFLGMSSVAIYDLAIRLLNLASIPIAVYTDAIFAKSVREKSNRLLKISILIVIAVSIIISLFSYFIFPYFIYYFAGSDMLKGLKYYNVMIGSLPVIGLSLILARLGLIAFNYGKQYMKAMLLTVVFYLICITLGAILNLLSNLMFYVLTAFLSYFFEMMVRFYYVKKLRVL